jgi:hypothetical protein
MPPTELSPDDRQRLATARRQWVAESNGISTNGFESAVSKAKKQAGPSRGIELFPLPPRSISQQEGRS